MKHPRPRRCVICGAVFTPSDPRAARANVCGADCRRERKRRTSAKWYTENTRRQILAVLARRRKR